MRVKMRKAARTDDKSPVCEVKKILEDLIHTDRHRLRNMNFCEFWWRYSDNRSLLHSQFLGACSDAVWGVAYDSVEEGPFSSSGPQR